MSLSVVTMLRDWASMQGFFDAWHACCMHIIFLYRVQSPFPDCRCAPHRMTCALHVVVYLDNISSNPLVVTSEDEISYL